MQNLTIFTDASHCPETKVGAGAFWSRTGEHFLKRAFALGNIDQSHKAELITALTAITTCLDAPEYQQYFTPAAEKVLIILVTDCLYVKQVLEGKVMADEQYRDRIRGILNRLWIGGISIKVNHVKAHSGTGEPRKWVNTWCDREAKKIMRGLRDRVRVTS